MIKVPERILVIEVYNDKGIFVTKQAIVEYRYLLMKRDVIIGIISALLMGAHLWN